MTTLAVTKITSKMEKTKSQADMALAQFFTASVKKRTGVLEAIGGKNSTVLVLVESPNVQSAANTTVSHEDVEDILQKLCDVNECTLSDLITATTENINKINDLQIENARLRNKQLEKSREELYGPEGTDMDGEFDPYREVLTNNHSDRELSLQLMRKVKLPRREKTPYLSSGKIGLELTAVIDTGSQITIMPLSFLLKAKMAGADDDTLCKEVATHKITAFESLVVIVRVGAYHEKYLVVRNKLIGIGMVEYGLPEGSNDSLYW
ncbi:unnamed protein product [Haemonchus placei]|uniref:Peptidase A2 domain-containing protein n=1 Tax=Haemonchus placei TaxID=6290 RepID=A0A0N4WQW3_HAEPC|nr:unnamed protein product [Haemonchus placei]